MTIFFFFACFECERVFRDLGNRRSGFNLDAKSEKPRFCRSRYVWIKPGEYLGRCFREEHSEITDIFFLEDFFFEHTGIIYKFCGKLHAARTRASDNHGYGALFFYFFLNAISQANGIVRGF